MIALAAINFKEEEGSVLKKSAFFAVKETDIVVSRAEGVFNGNRFSLFRIDADPANDGRKIYSSNDMKDSDIFFREVPYFREENLIPISQEEWEKKRGRSFNLELSFRWFTGAVSKYGVFPLFRRPWACEEFITQLTCYRDPPKIKVVSSLVEWEENGELCHYDGGHIISRTK